MISLSKVQGAGLWIKSLNSSSFSNFLSRPEFYSKKNDLLGMKKLLSQVDRKRKVRYDVISVESYKSCSTVTSHTLPFLTNLT